MDKHVLLSRITTRENEVIRLLAQGLTTKQIAEKLNTSSPYELRTFLLEDNEEETLNIISKSVAIKVHTVEKVYLTKTETNPPLLCIIAVGTVVSTGWKNPRLSQVIYVTPPIDNIWEFEFIADEPTGIVIPVTMPVISYHIVPSLDWKGITILASQNSKTVVIGNPTEVKDPGYFLVQPTG